MVTFLSLERFAQESEIGHKTGTIGARYTQIDTSAFRCRRYLLRVISGPDVDFSIPLDAGSFLLGSHENNDIVLRDPTVSRYHLELQVRDGGIRVKDQQSTNGTFVGKTALLTFVWVTLIAS